MSDKYDDEIFNEIMQLSRKRHMRSLEILAGGISHEFNNLLSGIIGYSQMALNAPDDSKLAQRALNICFNAAKKGADISKRMSYFSKTSKIEFEVIDPIPVLTDVIEIFRHQLEDESIKLDTDLGQLVPVRIDTSLFCLAMVEVMQNAMDSCIANKDKIDFPKMLIRTRIEDGEAVIRVFSNGTIPEDITTEELMVPFINTQNLLKGGDNSATDGIGVASAYGILRDMSCSLTLDIGENNSGIEVRIAMPPASDYIKSEKARILVIDDEPPIRRIFESILTRNGYDVTCAKDAVEALKILDDNHFSLILLDQMMPAMSGIQFLEKVKFGTHTYTKAPVVMITASHSPEFARKAISMGAAACAAKPINKNKILYFASRFTGMNYRHPSLSSISKTSMENDFPDRVMIVDNDNLSRDIMETILTKSGYNVISTSLGKDAILKTETDYYNIILMDIHLHDVDPFDTIRKIRLNNPYTPILVTTARASNDAVRKALEAGANKFLTKPIDYDGILMEVRELVELFRENE